MMMMTMTMTMMMCKVSFKFSALRKNSKKSAKTTVFADFFEFLRSRNLCRFYRILWMADGKEPWKRMFIRL